MWKKDDDRKMMTERYQNQRVTFRYYIKADKEIERKFFRWSYYEKTNKIFMKWKSLKRS